MLVFYGLVAGAIFTVGSNECTGATSVGFGPVPAGNGCVAISPPPDIAKASDAINEDRITARSKTTR